jgi:hypothetical protein
MPVGLVGVTQVGGVLSGDGRLASTEALLTPTRMRARQLHSNMNAQNQSSAASTGPKPRRRYHTWCWLAWEQRAPIDDARMLAGVLTLRAAQ